jgi:hypothetical protein
MSLFSGKAGFVTEPQAASAGHPQSPLHVTARVSSSPISKPAGRMPCDFVRDGVSSLASPTFFHQFCFGWPPVNC